MDISNFKLFTALTEKDHEDRKKGIGGSDAAAVLGQSRYKTPLDIYNDKLGFGEPFEGNMYTALGDYLEDFIREMYAEAEGIKLLKPESIVHKDFPWMRCNLDFVSEDHLRAGEFKVSFSNKGWGEEGTDEMPIEYLIQCAHNRLAAASYYGVDYETFYLVRLSFGYKPELKKYVYKKNERLESILLNKEENLWINHIVKRIPPEPSNLKDDSIQIIDEAVIADDVVIELYERHNDIKNQMSGLKSQEEEIKELLKNSFGNKTTLVTDRGDRLVTWKPSITKRFDTTKFKGDMPDIYNEYIKESQIRTMRFM